MGKILKDKKMSIKDRFLSLCVLKRLSGMAEKGCGSHADRILSFLSSIFAEIEIYNNEICSTKKTQR